MLSHVMNDVATIIIPYQTFWLLRNMYIPSTNAISECLKWSIKSNRTPPGNNRAHIITDLLN